MRRVWCMERLVHEMHPCMIEFNEMLLRRLGKNSRFTGKAVAPYICCQSLRLCQSHRVIGVEKGSHPLRPPNRACGSPAHGSPVSSFLIGIGSLTFGLLSWCCLLYTSDAA